MKTECCVYHTDGGMADVPCPKVTPLPIKDIVKGTTARFSFYRNGNMFYVVPVTHAGLGFPVNYQFPVSLEDIGSASLFTEMKSITLMRYIRKVP